VSRKHQPFVIVGGQKFRPLQPPRTMPNEMKDLSAVRSVSRKWCATRSHLGCCIGRFRSQTRLNSKARAKFGDGGGEFFREPLGHGVFFSQTHATQAGERPHAAGVR